MLNNLTNFFNLIVGGRIKSELEPSDLIAIGTKQSSKLGDYKPTAIEFKNLQAQLAPEVDGISIVGTGLPGDPLRHGVANYEFESGADPESFSTLDKINDYTVSFNGQEYDVYKLKGIVLMSGGTNVYTMFPGSIITSSNTFLIINNASNVEAFDQLFGGVVNTSFGTGSLVEDEAVLTTAPIDFLFANYDNAVTTPDEYFIFVFGGASFDFNCRISIDMEIIVEKGSTVQYSTF